MFKGIKVKLLKRGKIQKVRLLSLLQDFEDRLEALEQANGGSSDEESDDDSSSGSTEQPLVNVSIHTTDGINPLPNTTVQLLKGDTVVGECVTGSAGGCTIKNVPSGDNYSINANAVKDNTNYYCHVNSISINENKEVNLELTRV